MLRPLAEGLWVCDWPLRVFGLAIGTRMTVVRLSDGGLWLHSPVPLDAATRRELDDLGPVRFAVAPNKVHHLFAAPVRERYPEARVLAAPGLATKRREIAFDGELTDEPLWGDDLDQAVVHGAPYLGEVAFCHRASRTLLLTDLAMNFRGSDSFLTRCWLRAMGIHGRFATSRLIRTLVRDRPAFRASLERIFAWDFERVVVTHGAVLPRHGKRLLREALAWA